jgi:hypothetical protein
MDRAVNMILKKGIFLFTRSGCVDASPPFLPEDEGRFFLRNVVLFKVFKTF